MASEARIVLETRGVTKRYQLENVEVNALRGVDVAIRQGEMVSIMGPSGSGKSTLMHIIGLLDRPSAGQVVLEGQDVSRLAPNELAALRNRYIGFVFQAFNLLPRTTALANVELPLVYGGVGGAERSKRAKAALERVGLGDRMGHFSSQLSGGQQQRVAIARALVNDPSIVLADEPTGNLDSRSGIEIMAVLQDLSSHGITVVVVTHDDRVARHSERIIHVFDGRVRDDAVLTDRIMAAQELAELPPEEGMFVNFVESFRIAFRALAANKARSLLTMLGVVIGVAAVILLVGIGLGVEDEVTGSLEGLGSNLLFVVPGQYEGSMGGGTPPGRRFTLEDVEVVQKRVEGASAVVPVLTAGATAKAGNRSVRVVVAGGSDQGPEVFTNNLAGGRHYRRGEVQAASRVVALGSRVAEELFPNQDPVGKQITLDGQRFAVIGYYESLGGGLAGDQDTQVYIPVTTAQRLFNLNYIAMIVVKAADPDRVDVVRAEIQRALEPRFGDEFTVFSQEQTLGILSDLLGTLTYMLAGIAGISLLVGGIGIMNIMLVSVSERTREIGIRKAVGARTYDILSQFVIEAVSLSVLGGVIGIALGWGGAMILSKTTPVPTNVTPWAVAMSFFFALGVGVFFGVYPAWKASQLDPIEALRYE